MNVFESIRSSYVQYCREYAFNIILCRKLRWTCQKHSNGVVQQVEAPGKATILRHKFHVAWRLRYAMTGKQVDAGVGAFLV